MLIPDDDGSIASENQSASPRKIFRANGASIARPGGTRANRVYRVYSAKGAMT